MSRASLQPEEERVQTRNDATRKICNEENEFVRNLMEEMQIENNQRFSALTDQAESSAAAISKTFESLSEKLDKGLTTQGRSLATTDLIVAKLAARADEPTETVNEIRTAIRDLTSAVEKQPANPAREQYLGKVLSELRSDLNRVMESRSESKAVPSTAATPERAPDTEEPNWVSDMVQRVLNAAKSPIPKKTKKAKVEVIDESSSSDDEDDRKRKTSIKKERDEESDADSSSDDSEEELVYGLSFWERRRGPKHTGLSVIKPSNPAFDRLLDYRFYRLKKHKTTRTSRETGKVRSLLKQMELTMKNRKFSGSD